jgi:WD40 repeat protein
MMHDGPVTCVTFSANGRWLASAGEDHTVRLWSVGSGRPGKVLRHVDLNVMRVLFTPDGRRLLSGTSGAWAGQAGSVYRWDLETGQFLGRASANQNGVLALALSHDGKTLASSGPDGIVHLRRASDLKEILTLEQTGGHVTALEFSPDDDTLAGTTTEGKLWLWTLSTGGRKTMDVQPQGGGSSLAFAPEGSEVFCGTFDGGVVGYGTALGDRRGIRVTGNGRGPARVAVSPDGRLLATAAGDLIRIYSRPSGGLARTLTAGPSTIWSLAFSPQGTVLASGGDDHTVRLWDVATGQERRPEPGSLGATADPKARRR